MIDPFDPVSATAPGANGSPAQSPPSVEALLFGAGAISADQLGELVRDAVLSERPVAALALERGFANAEMLKTLFANAGVDVSLAEIVGEEAAPVEVAAPAPLEPVAPPLAQPPLDSAPVQVPVPSPVVRASEPVASAIEHPEAFDPPAPSGFEPPAVIHLAPRTTAAESSAPAPPVAPAVPPPVVLAPPIVPSVSLDERVRAAVARAAEGASPEPLPAAAEEAVRPEPAEAGAAFSVLVRLQSGEQVAVDKVGSFERAADLARTLAGRFATAGEWPFVAGRCIRPDAVVSIDVERALEG